MLLLICTKDPSSTTREKGSEDTFGLMEQNMRESSRPTGSMEKENTITQMAQVGSTEDDVTKVVWINF